jgi:phosphatidylserine/phosphatidylglycerophosphate/cardiolipin synthase-like enzyme
MNMPSCEKLTVAVTGTAWMGGGVGSVQSAMEELFDRADHEIQIAVYQMTVGATKFLKRLQECLARGIRVTIIINRYDEQPVEIKKELSLLSAKFPHFEILNFQPRNSMEDLHAKIMVVDRASALVGSANLTWKGLVGNHELAVVVYGSVASKIGELFDRLSQDARIQRMVNSNEQD